MTPRRAGTLRPVVMRALILVAALLLAGPASALELRHGPPEPGCQQASPRGETVVAAWSGELGGPNSGRAWRLLLEAGPPGCAAVAAWLGEGAPAASDEEVAAAVLALARRGTAEDLGIVLSALAHPSDQVVAAALFGLRSRLPRLDAVSARRVVDAALRPWAEREDAPDPRASALGLLLGRHAEGRVELEQNGPVTVPRWVETTVWAVDDLPAAHREAVVAVLAAQDPAAERAFATLALALFEEQRPQAVTLGPLLVPLLARAPTDRITAWAAAQALGRGQPEGVDAAVDAALQQRNPPYVAPRLLDGFEDRARAEGADDAMIARLRRLRALPVARTARRAERLRRRLERKGR